MNAAARLRFTTALAWAAVSGMLALAWEIVWSRLFNFVSGSQAVAFGAMLGSYLLGFACGALLSRRWHDAASAMPRPGVWVAVAGVIAFLVAPMSALLVTHIAWHWCLVLVAVCGALLGVVFPMVCHRALAADEAPGARVSYLYVANIVGSGFGSLFTGFVLMDRLGIAALSLLLLLTGHLWAEWMSGWRLPLKIRLLSLAAAACAPLLFSGFYERLMLKTRYEAGTRFETVIESKHGVITVDKDKNVHGNGEYDGYIKLEPSAGSGMMRPYFPSAVLEKVEDVLVIGVSSGTWTRILSCHPQVRKVTAIEISSGYLKLIAAYPEVSPILNDPKVEIVVDDGRRWLRRNPARKFDLVVMNTAVHWREFATAVLSREMLEMVKAALKPGGIVTWNCTGSGRAVRTGMEVFPHTIMMMNFCVASESPLIPDRERWRSVLSTYRIGGRPVIDKQSEQGRANLEGLLGFIDHQGDQPDDSNWRWLTREQMQTKWSNERIITDDNLGHEYP